MLLPPLGPPDQSPAPVGASLACWGRPRSSSQSWGRGGVACLRCSSSGCGILGIGGGDAPPSPKLGASLACWGRPRSSSQSPPRSGRGGILPAPCSPAPAPAPTNRPGWTSGGGTPATPHIPGGWTGSPGSRCSGGGPCWCPSAAGGGCSGGIPIGWWPCGGCIGADCPACMGMGMGMGICMPWPGRPAIAPPRPAPIGGATTPWGSGPLLKPGVGGDDGERPRGSPGGEPFCSSASSAAPSRAPSVIPGRPSPAPGGPPRPSGGPPCQCPSARPCLSHPPWRWSVRGGGSGRGGGGGSAGGVRGWGGARGVGARLGAGRSAAIARPGVPDRRRGGAGRSPSHLGGHAPQPPRNPPPPTSPWSNP